MSWFAFDILAYEADTPHLSTIEHGAYFLLIKHYMRTRMALLDDDQALANIVLMPVEKWAEVAPRLRSFFKARAGRLHQKRCDEVLDAEDRRSTGRSEHAKKAAEARWNENNNLRAASINGASSEHAQSMLDDAIRPDTIGERKKDYRAKSPLNGHAEDFEIFYVAYPLHKGRGQAERAFVAALKSAAAPDLIAGATRYATECRGREQRFIKHPATWLNGKCWLDQPLASDAGHPEIGRPFG